MRRINIGMNSSSGMGVMACLFGFFVLFLALTGAADARQHVDYGGSCDGTSECYGNLSCHSGGLQLNLRFDNTCECPEPGDGSYSTGRHPDSGEARPVCWGAGVPCERHWDPEYGAFGDCQVHVKTEFGQFDSLIIGLAPTGTHPLHASADRNSRVSGTVNGSGAGIWVVWCEPTGSQIWCNIDFNGQNGWIEMEYVAFADIHRGYPNRPRS